MMLIMSKHAKLPALRITPRGKRRWNMPVAAIAAILARRDGWRCWLCRKPFPRKRRFGSGRRDVTIHHKIPLARGGSPSSLDNLCIAHRSCNSKHGTGESPSIEGDMFFHGSGEPGFGMTRNWIARNLR